jgi:hypothetical protein
MRSVWIALVSVLMVAGCDEAPAPPSPSPEPAPARAEETPEDAPAPPCADDAECEVVAVPCVGEDAVHRDRASSLRARWEREGASQSCRRPPWAPPRELRAHCREATCVLDVVTWPALRACTDDAECEVIDDPCDGPLGVRRDRVSEARTAVATPARAERCAGRRDAIAAALGADVEDDAPTAPTCADGFCRP